VFAESAGARAAQYVVVIERIVAAGKRAHLLPLRPLDLVGRHGNEQRPGKAAAAADAGLVHRLLRRHLADAFAQGRAAERLDRHEVDGAGDAGLETFGRETADRADARFARGELAPVVLDAGAERRDDAHSGDDHDRPPALVV